MSALRIRVRESHIDLRSIAGGLPGALVVDVPVDPIKADRGTTIFPWPLAEQGRMILKVYGEMGVLNWFRKQVVGYRARREFRTLAWLRAASIECCEPILWGTGRSREHGLFEVLATREIERAVTLESHFGTLTSTEREGVVARVYEQLARMHQAGVYHGAPYFSNVLLDADRWRTDGIAMVDLEKSVRYGRDIRGSRMASFDLLNLVNATRTRLGDDDAHAGLLHYGLDAAASERVFEAVKAYRSSKFQRYRRRAEFLARGVLSRTFRGRGAVLGGGLEPSVGSPRP
jgi:tRNA A-37 threonylcarbamoyl transferase component Bud32